MQLRNMPGMRTGKESSTGKTCGKASQTGKEVVEMKPSKQQIYTVIAAILFLIGAVFMLVSTFGAVSWAFYVGLGFAAAAIVIYILYIVETKKKPKPFEEKSTSPLEKK